MFVNIDFPLFLLYKICIPNPYNITRGDEMKITKDVLNNGLRVLVAPRTDVEGVTIVLALRAGSRRETPQNSGVAHFLEHMFFRGGKRHPDQRSTVYAIERAGGEANAYTGHDEVAYTISVPAGAIATAFDVLSDMLLNARLRASDIRVERGAVLEELSQRNENYAGLAWEECQRLLYGDTRLGNAVIGTAGTIGSFAHNDFVSFRKTMYNAQDAVLAVCGKVTPDRVFRLAERYFSDLPKESPGHHIPVEPAELWDDRKISIVQSGGTQTHICLFAPAPSASSPEHVVAEITATVLGGGMSSRLFLNVRSKRGLAYSTYASFNSGPDYGNISIYAGTSSPKRVEEALGAIMNEINVLKSATVSKEDLSCAKEYRAGETVRALESSMVIAMELASSELLLGRTRTISELVHATDEVSSEDVTSMAGNVFRPGALRLAVVGPYRGTEERLHDILAS